MSALEIHVRKVTAEKLDSAGLRFGQISTRENRFGHVRIAEIRFAEVCARKIGAGKLGFAQVRSLKASVAKNAAGQICPGQVRVRKVRAGEIGARAAVFSAEKTLMRLENFHQRFSVVLDVFQFSETHTVSTTKDSNL